MKTTLLSLIVAALLLVIPAPANTDVVMFPAELSVSFEAVQGRVVLAGDQVLFWSDSATYPSFYFHKAIVGRSGIANNVLTVETQEPIRIQDGSRSRFDFRMTGTADASSIERWFAQPAGVMAGPSGSTSAAAPFGSAGAMPGISFDAEHTRRFGGNRNGKLVFTSKGVAWESLDDATQSRNWEYKVIRQLDRKNPYELVIDTFADGKYSFKMTTKPIGNEDFSVITDYLAAARREARQ